MKSRVRGAKDQVEDESGSDNESSGSLSKADIRRKEKRKRWRQRKQQERTHQRALQTAGENEELRQLISDDIEKLENLQSSHSALRRELTDAKDKNAMKEAEIKKLKHQLEKAKSDAGARGSLRSKEETKKIKEDLERLQADRDELSAQLAVARDSLTSKSKVEEKLKLLNQHQQEKDAQLKRASSDASAQEKAAKAAEAKAQKLTAEVESVKTDKEKAEKAAKAAEAKAQKLAAEVEALKSDTAKADKLEKLEKAAEARVQKLTAESESLKSDKEKAEKAVKAAEARAQKLAAEVESLKTQRDEAVSAADKEVKNRAMLEAKLSEWQAKVKEWEQQIATLASSLEKAKKEQLLLKQQKELAEKEQLHMKQQKEALEKEQGQLKKQKESLEGDLSAQEKKFTAQLTTLNKKLEEANKNSSTLSGEVGSLKQRSEVLVRETEEQKKELTQLRAESAVSALELETARGKLGHFDQGAKSLGARLEAAMEKVKIQLPQTPTKAKSGDGLGHLNHHVDHFLKHHSALVDNYKKEVKDREACFNQIQELRGNIRVSIRVRPVLPSDRKRSADESQEYLNYVNTKTLEVPYKTGSKRFKLDRVFPPEAKQSEIFDDTSQLIRSCMDGYNVCILAYGQTGSGKTYTMEGPPDDRGVNHLAIKELFKLKKERSDFTYQFFFSMVEIYNEEVFNLLDSAKVARVDSLTEIEVKSEDDVIKNMTIGASNRAVAGTNMNERSSRSHSILTVRVVGRNTTSDAKYDGKLRLVDLAGSERLDMSGATGETLQETKAINASLSQLGIVLSKLQHKEKHIPYRSSTLTLFLQDSLGGNSKCMMFVNLSPILADVKQTRLSVEFAHNASQVELGQAQQNFSKTSRPSGTGEPATPSGERKTEAGRLNGTTTSTPRINTLTSPPAHRPKGTPSPATPHTPSTPHTPLTPHTPVTPLAFPTTSRTTPRPPVTTRMPPKVLPTSATKTATTARR